MKLFSTFVAGNCRKTAQVEELITSTFIHMKHKILLLFIAIQTIAFGQQSMEFFFDKTSFNAEIPSPEEFFKQTYGTRHLDQHEILSYFFLLSSQSDRMQMVEYGRTYENRPLYLLTISHADNMAKLEDIRAQHVLLADPPKSKSLDTKSMPVVVWMGYGVHGNEQSAANTAVLMAYYLAAAEGEQIEEQLKQAVVLIDPLLNPDGFTRATSWSNAQQNYTLNTDPNNRQLAEAWPGGRSNHYWFDLNRDWLPLQHPESRGRMQQYHRWYPNVLTDHHEMGTDASFFFQPGVASRSNHHTPKKNYLLTQLIGTYHAKALDQIGSYYFTEEVFDDFYYGKGSTYPDVNGCIGILFEQSRQMGQAVETSNGVVHFRDAIRNQLTVSLSTLKAATENREVFLNYQRDFFQQSKTLARNDTEKAYVFGELHDRTRCNELLSMLLQHKIKVYQAKNDWTSEGTTIPKANSYVVPLDQPQYRLVKSIFEQNTQFEDSLFYDISAWTMPLAFGIPYKAIDDRQLAQLQGDVLTKIKESSGSLQASDKAIAYVYRWNYFLAPQFTYQLLQAGVNIKIARKPFSAQVNGESVSFGYGTAMIPLHAQSMGRKQIDSLVQHWAKASNVDLYGISTGLTATGIDFGSNSFTRIEKPKVLMITGSGIRSTSAGEIWHLLDYRFRMPITMVDQNRFGRINLYDYNTLILPEGRIQLSKAQAEKIQAWVRNGGTVIAIKSANNWLNRHKLIKLTSKKDSYKEPENVAYADIRNLRGAQYIGGAIFEAKLDITHPIGYGFWNSKVAVFKNDEKQYEKSTKLGQTPLQLTDSPLLAGYLSQQKEELVQSVASVIVTPTGKGSIISFVDNPNFRAFWFGTNSLFMNAIFFGQLM